MIIKRLKMIRFSLLILLLTGSIVGHAQDAALSERLYSVKQKVRAELWYQGIQVKSKVQQDDEVIFESITMDKKHLIKKYDIQTKDS